jgi:prepilin-type processing-associated H-X9-DG protein
MSIETILRLVLLAGAMMAIFVGFTAYKWGSNSRAKAALIALVSIWTALTLGGGLYLTPKIGPLVRNEGFLLALAPIGALVGGLASGRRKAVGLSPVLVIAGFTVLVIIDLEAFYRLNHTLADVAGSLGIGAVHQKYEPTANKECPENLKSLYFAFAQYVEGNGSLPPAEKWMDNEEIASKVQKEEWFHCPEVSNRHDNHFGYAYNDSIAGRSLNGKKLNELTDAVHTPLLYDSTNLAKSAHDAFVSLPKPGRHGGRNNVLYCDGHVEAK